VYVDEDDDLALFQGALAAVAMTAGYVAIPALLLGGPVLRWVAGATLVLCGGYLTWRTARR